MQSCIVVPSRVRNSRERFPPLKKFPNDLLDLEALAKATRQLVRNLDMVIDNTTYPTDRARRSNVLHRPIGIGVQGFADVLQMLRLPWDSDATKTINLLIFECIYFNAIFESMNLAVEKGPHPSFYGSPASKGILQYHMWDKEPKFYKTPKEWDVLVGLVKDHGLRNSLLTSLMPTASTASIMGNVESFETTVSNVFTRRTLAGEFIIINKHMYQDFLDMGVWDEDTKTGIIARGGSVQHLKSKISGATAEIYKTVWEVRQKTLIDLAADRAPFIDQSASLNLFVPRERLTNNTVTSMFFYVWNKGLKGTYYLRTQPASEAVKVTVPAGVSSEMGGSVGYGDESDSGECVQCSA